MARKLIQAANATPRSQKACIGRYFGWTDTSVPCKLQNLAPGTVIGASAPAAGLPFTRLTGIPTRAVLRTGSNTLTGVTGPLTVIATTLPRVPTDKVTLAEHLGRVWQKFRIGFLIPRLAALRDCFSAALALVVRNFKADAQIQRAMNKKLAVVRTGLIPRR